MNTIKDQNRAIWRVRLVSALRTVIACSIVGCTTLYGPAPLRRVLTYPSVSYVTAILIVSEATLGDTLRGFCQALYATVQVLFPSWLSLWIIGPARFTRELAAVAVAISTFVVALPESTPLLTKRLAFGQMVIVYVGTVVHGSSTGSFMHPIHVASSTTLGALASVLAVLLPFPRLAYREVRKACRLYAENASQRLSLVVEAISAQHTSTTHDLIAQQKYLSQTGLKLVQTVNNNLGGMVWESPQIIFLKPNCAGLGEKLQDMEIPIREMERALSSCTLFPVDMIDEEFKELLQSLKLQIRLKLEHDKCFVPFDATTAPEVKGDALEKPLWMPKTNIKMPENLPALFLLYCMEFLLNGSPSAGKIEDNPTKKTEESNKSKSDDQRVRSCVFLRSPSSQSLIFALKCSVSLGLSVLFGLMYNTENGYWSGLTIAIGFVTGREATFIVANARAQGTAMGSIYGVLCSFIFQRVYDLRFLPLLPWIVFTSFLIHSRTYGQAGAFSAAIGALLILGRKGYGAPSDFAIARLTEATIGLICFILVELLLNPARAATLAKAELSESIGLLRECMENIILRPHQKNMSGSRKLREKQHQLKYHVDKLQHFISEAQMEPNFWFMPFQSASYGKLLGLLSRLVNLLHFVVYQIEFTSEISQRLESSSENLLQNMNDDLELLKDTVSSSLKQLEAATSTRSLQVLKEGLQTEKICCDLEMGKSPNKQTFRSPDRDEGVKGILSSFLQHLEEVIDKIYTWEGTEKLKSQMVLCLTGIGYCIHSLATEIMEIEKEVKDLQ
ncbi:hypothetical protein UlMin_000174 [Ulmus minor]